MNLSLDEVFALPLEEAKVEIESRYNGMIHDCTRPCKKPSLRAYLSHASADALRHMLTLLEEPNNRLTVLLDIRSPSLLEGTEVLTLVAEADIDIELLVRVPAYTQRIGIWPRDESLIESFKGSLVMKLGDRLEEMYEKKTSRIQMQALGLKKELLLG